MILLTGATGFLGKHLLGRLQADGRPVCPASKHAQSSECKEEFQQLDMEDPESFDNLPEQIDTVIHLAALVPQKGSVFSFDRYMAINATGVKRLIQESARRGCREFIYASTQMVIEKALHEPVDEDHPVVPISDYGFSKATGERFCLSLGAELGVKSVSLRFARIYGPWQRPGYVLTDFIDRARQGLPLHVFGAQGTRELIYVTDAVEAILAVMEAKLSGIFNIGTGRSVTTLTLAETIADVFSGGVSTVLISEMDAGPTLSDFCFDVTKAKRDLGFSARFTLKEGLRDYKLALERGS
ncbi:MAG: NAD(P)-dependent oxidoreductase [Candidatus Omnitrophota bacterium]